MPAPSQRLGIGIVLVATLARTSVAGEPRAVTSMAMAA
jgi:hypothetical protein